VTAHIAIVFTVSYFPVYISHTYPYIPIYAYVSPCCLIPSFPFAIGDLVYFMNCAYYRGFDRLYIDLMYNFT
jgi:hypothetical protein